MVLYKSLSFRIRSPATYESAFRKESANLNGIVADTSCNASLRLQLHGAIYRPDSFVLMLRYCANLKAIRYESTSLNRIVADKSHSVIVA